MSQGLSHRVAVYTGTFDPVHRGHLDIIGRGSQVFDRLIVGVGINPDKQPVTYDALVDGSVWKDANAMVK